MASSDWQPIRRIAAPQVTMRETVSPTAITVSFKITPRPDDEWERLFKGRTRERGVSIAFDSFVVDKIGGYTHVEDDDLETAVAVIDEAIEYANGQYEAVVLPRRKEDEAEREKASGLARQRLASLNERASKLGQPNPNAASLDEYRDL